MMKSCTHPDSGFVAKPKNVKNNIPKGATMMPKKEMHHALMGKGTNLVHKGGK